MHAYGVAEIPTNVLIGRDGNVVHLDLSRKNLETVDGSVLALIVRAILAAACSPLPRSPGSVLIGCGAGGGVVAGLAAWARDSYSDSMNMWNVSDPRFKRANVCKRRPAIFQQFLASIGDRGQGGDSVLLRFRQHHVTRLVRDVLLLLSAHPRSGVLAATGACFMRHKS